MIGPRLAATGTRDERRMLRAAQSDGPRADLRAKILFSVGVGAATAAATSTSLATVGSGAASGASALSPILSAVGSGTSSGSAGAVAVGAVPSAAAPFGVAILVKWVGIASVALSVGVGSGFVAGSHWADTGRSAVEHLPRQPWVGQGLTPTTTEPSNLVTRDAAVAVARAPEKLTLSPPRTAATPSDRTSSDTIAEEIRLVDESRAALRLGDPSHCLRLLNERRQRFPNGALSPEAALLHIEALSAVGQREAAAREATRFLARYPTGPLAGRVRALLARPTTSDDPTSELRTEAM